MCISVDNTVKQQSGPVFQTLRRHSLLKAWIISICALGFMITGGCAAGPDFVKPEAPRVNSYNYGGDAKETVAAEGQTQRFMNGTEPAANWWKLFNSRQLDAIVSEGFQNNPGLQAAQASLRESRENLRAGSGIFYPQVSATFGQLREKSSPSSSGSSLPGNIFNLSTLSASVSYVLDIFGGQRRTVEGLAAQVDQERALTLATYIMLSGNMVNTSIAISAYQEEINEIEQLVNLEKDQVTIAEKQYKAGLTTYVSVLALQNQLKALEASLPPIKQKYSQAEHLLATLIGKTPAEWQSPKIRLSEISLPVDLPLSLPSELVRQRPDILAAEAQLHAASAGIGVANAALFPSLTLNASYGQTSLATSNLFDKASNVWGLGANIAAPVFNGGALRAKRRAAVAAYEQSFANYRQTVLSAFAQVADILRALEHDAEVTRKEAEAVETAQLSMNLVQANYKAGLVNYLQVLLTDLQYHQAKIAYLQAKAQQLQDTTALFVALGGGWKNDVTANKKIGRSET